MNNRSWFARTFRIVITFLVFAFYIGAIFFAFRQNWQFLLTFEYWIDTSTSTALAFMFRFLYSDEGINKELEDNNKIKQQEEGKAKLIARVNGNNLTGELKDEIEKRNKRNKLKEYKNKIDGKIMFYQNRSKLFPFRKTLLKKWQTRKQNMKNEDFNIEGLKVKHYRYNLDEMLSSFYKEPNKNRYTRMNKDQFVFSSLRTNMITIIAFMVYNALSVFAKEFTQEDLWITSGKLIIFALNIYTGYGLGRKFISNEYGSNLSEDYTFLKEFLKIKGVN